MDLNKLREVLAKDVENMGYHLYSLEFQKKDNILEVLIDESLDLDGISALSEKISAVMDNYDEDFGNYLLDVSSVGVERPIRNEEEAAKAVGSYVHVKTKAFEMDGTLKSFDGGVLVLEYMDKNIRKKVSIDYKDVKLLRYAVKF